MSDNRPCLIEQNEAGTGGAGIDCAYQMSHQPKPQWFAASDLRLMQSLSTIHYPLFLSGPRPRSQTENRR
jgi:hypothetical protein